MTVCNIRSIAQSLLALFAALALLSCGGGGGDDDTNDGRPSTTTPTSAQAASRELVDAFAATLTGTQQTPQNQSNAQGSGTVVLIPATGQITVTTTTTGTAATSVTVDQGTPGTRGPTLLTLTETPPGSGIWSAQGSLTATQVDALRNGQLYVNVRTAAFPNGEIRGQLLSQQPTTSSTRVAGIPSPADVASVTTFVSALRGQNEVPPTPSTAQGSGTVLVNSANRLLVGAVTTIGLAGTEAHIQLAPPGVNGPISIPLVETSPGSGVWTVRTTLTDTQFNALQNGDLYFNVRSFAFPNGEIRGQIVPQRLDQALVDMIDDINEAANIGATPGATSASFPVPTPSAIGSINPGTGIGGTGIGTTGGIGSPGIGSVGTGIGTIGSPGTGIGVTTGSTGTTGGLSIGDTSGIATPATGMTGTASLDIGSATTPIGFPSTTGTATGITGTTGGSAISIF